MKTIYLNLSPKGNLEIYDFNNRDKDAELTLDIMEDFEGSISEWEKVKSGWNTNGYGLSSAIDFPSEFNVDGQVLENFIQKML